MYDTIVTLYFLKEGFEENVRVWFEEIPIKTLYLGIGHNNEDVWKRVKELPYDNIKIIDQTHLKTLGGCLVDLMKRIETEWFVYLHGDVQPTEGSLAQMETFMKKSKMGIIESEHLHVYGKKKKYFNYYDELRSYSAFQLIYKPSIENWFNKIEDDYIYRNEDLIFQNVCEYNGFEYKKTMAMHFHYPFEDDKVSFNLKDTHEMQWKGLVKYSPLITPLMIDLIIGAIRHNINFFGVKIDEIIEFTKENNDIWLDLIEKHFNYLIRGEF